MKLINCDMGECLTPDPDEMIMPLVDMANIACGGHAGDQFSMDKTIQLAQKHQVKVGVHPSYIDQKNFGRISHPLDSNKLFDLIEQQLKAFLAVCELHDTTMHYIKPHGALYHDMMNKPEVLDIICQLIQQINPQVSLVVQADMHVEHMAEKSEQTSINFIYEAFADRTYRGHEIVPRSETGAMLMDAQEIVAQYHLFSTEHSFRVDTICFHSDHPASVLALKLLKGR